MMKIWSKKEYKEKLLHMKSIWAKTKLILDAHEEHDRQKCFVGFCHGWSDILPFTWETRFLSIFEQSITWALVFTHSIIRRALWSYSLAVCRCKCSIIQVTEDKSFNLATDYSHHTPVTEDNSSISLVLFLTEKTFTKKSKRSPNKTMHAMDWSFWKQSNSWP